MASTRKVSVAVVGAGVIGLSVAAHLLERFQDELLVTVIADKFSPNTISSDRSGGWILPVEFDKITPGEPQRAARWTKGTIRRLQSLYNSPEGGETGISLVTGYYMIDPLNTSYQTWSDFVQGFRFASKEERESYNFRTGATVLTFTTFTVSCLIYLPWLLKRFKGLGGVTKERKVNNLSELIGSYDIIINCTGLGARELANDPLVYPVRGHIVSVSAPWIKHFLEEFGHLRHKVYILPRSNDVILGGTYEPGIEDMSVDTLETRNVMERCQTAMPNLSTARVLDKWVGVRPFRKGGVRLEKETRNAYNDTDTIVIHCYGHGSDGVTLSWGCAQEIGDMINECILTKEDIKSKL